MNPALLESSTGKVILAAEDNPDDALFLKRAFDQVGIGKSLIVLADGQEVIDYLQGKPPFHDRTLCPYPSLLFLDIKMPRVTGLGVLEWLQRQPPEDRIPVFLFTSAVSASDLHRALALGARFCLTKPFNINDWVPIARTIAEQVRRPADRPN